MDRLFLCAGHRSHGVRAARCNLLKFSLQKSNLVFQVHETSLGALEIVNIAFVTVLALLGNENSDGLIKASIHK